jgi:FAD-linked sulfhydryl oxidase
MSLKRIETRSGETHTIEQQIFSMEQSLKRLQAEKETMEVEHKQIVEQRQREEEEWSIQKMDRESLENKWKKEDAERIELLSKWQQESVQQSTEVAPPDWRQAIGRNTWYFLHTVAAKYSSKPTEKEKESVRNLIDSLQYLYPCEVCRAHLYKSLQGTINPVEVESREQLSAWMCRLHNIVNTQLSKPVHDCSIRALDDKYLANCEECLTGKKLCFSANCQNQFRKPRQKSFYQLWQ